MLKQNIASILVPVYNQEKYIGRCLRSLLSQNFQRNEYQIIVIDDGSTDKTNYALELFKNEIILIKNKRNKGLPYSLNRGIRHSKSKYIVRVDSDDYVNEDFLKFLVSYLDQNNYMDAVACDYYKVDNNENIIDKYVASTLAILNKWKIRLFDIEKYQMIWILDKYNKQEEKGYCIIPTDEEIQKNTVIDKNEDRVRIINRYDPKICKIIHKHGLKLDTVEKREKFNIPYRTLGRFEDEICILNVKGNEIYWTIDDPVYRQNNVIFYTHDSDTFSNLLRLPIRKRDDNRYLSCFKYCKEKGMRLKLNPVVLESRILHCLKDFSLNITREAINLQGGGVRVSGEF